MRDRLFEPGDVQRLNGLRQIQRGGDRHALVGVHHYVDMRSHFLPHLAEALDVAFQFRRAHFDFNRPEPALHVGGDFAQQFFCRVGQPAAAAVEGHAFVTSAEQPPDWLGERFGPGIPHGHVERAQRPTLQTRLAEILRFLFVGLDKLPGLGNLEPRGEVANVIERSDNSIRRVVERQQIGISGDAIVQPDAGDDEGDLTDAVRAVGDRPRERRNSFEEVDRFDFRHRRFCFELDLI